VGTVIAAPAESGDPLDVGAAVRVLEAVHETAGSHDTPDLVETSGSLTCASTPQLRTAPNFESSYRKRYLFRAYVRVDLGIERQGHKRVGDPGP